MTSQHDSDTNAVGISLTSHVYGVGGVSGVGCSVGGSDCGSGGFVMQWGCCFCGGAGGGDGSNASGVRLVGVSHIVVGGGGYGVDGGGGGAVGKCQPLQVMQPLRGYDDLLYTYAYHKFCLTSTH